MSPPLATLRLGTRIFGPGAPAVMAIINRTPDSFYPRNRHTDLNAAMDAAGLAIDQGADIVDVGAVRAGQQGDWVDADEEIARLRPFLKEFRRVHAHFPLSIDTWRSRVIRAVESFDIQLVNDTWAGHDRNIVAAALDAGAALVCSHTGGLPPRTDPRGVTYEPEPNGVVDAVVRSLRTSAEAALSAGLDPDMIVLDPTLDFGKTTRHSLTVLRNTRRFVELGFPVLQAISRKDFVGETLDVAVEDRLSGSLAATAIAAWQGAAMFRSHDVEATRHAVDMVASILGTRNPAIELRGLE